MTPPLTRTDLQLLALQRQAKKYPKVKQKIKKIRERKAWGDFLSR